MQEKRHKTKSINKTKLSVYVADFEVENVEKLKMSALICKLIQVSFSSLITFRSMLKRHKYCALSSDFKCTGVFKMQDLILGLFALFVASIHTNKDQQTRETTVLCIFHYAS